MDAHHPRRPAGRSPTRSRTWPGPTAPPWPPSPTRTASGNWSSRRWPPPTGTSTTAPRRCPARPRRAAGRLAGRPRRPRQGAARVGPRGPLPWFGPPMAAASTATARLMETWAHGLDIADTLGVTRPPTDRLRHIARIGVRARDFAYATHGLTPPAEPFRVELTAPGGGAVDLRSRGRRPACHRPRPRLLPPRHPARPPCGPRPACRGARRRPLAGHRPGLRGAAGEPAAGRRGRSMTVLPQGNASGFYGDRFDAMREMLTGGPLDVLTGDYLAELTMLILGRDRLKDPDAGYAAPSCGSWRSASASPTSAASGSSPTPAGSTRRTRRRRTRPRHTARHPRCGSRTSRATTSPPPTRGAWPPTPTSAGSASPSACARAPTWSSPAGSPTPPWSPARGRTSAGRRRSTTGSARRRRRRTRAGCGAQATGGNYAFFSEGDVRRPGFPLAELRADGSCVVTKHDGTGGFVDVGTVTAQLLYETGGARYAGPDVTARLDTVRLTQDGPDRVRVEGVRGEAPPPTLKVGRNRLGGFRNEVAFVLTGPASRPCCPGAGPDGTRPRQGRRRPLGPGPHRPALTPRPRRRAGALLRLVVRDADQQVVGRALSGAAIELALASYPGFHVLAPPGKGAPYGVSRMCTSPMAPSTMWPSSTTGNGFPYQAPRTPPYCRTYRNRRCRSRFPPGPGTPRPLGLVAGARSGDRANANVGVWCGPTTPGAGWRTS